MRCSLLGLALLLAVAPTTAQVAAPQLAVPQQPAPADSAAAVAAEPPPPAAPAATATRAVADTLPADLAARLALIEAAVLANRSEMGDLAAGVASNRARADSLAARNAGQVAQETVQRVGEEARDAIQNFVPKLLLSALLVLLALYLLRGLVWLFEALAARSAERRLTYKRLIPIVRLLVWALTGYLVVAAVFQIPGGSLLAAAAAIGVAIGFAAQEVIKNIFGGLVIILDRPFQVGDKIAVSGTYGEVVSIGLRSTRIVTPDDNLVSVPNSQVVDGQVANANAGELNLQVVTDLWLPGWADVQLAKRIAYEAAANSRYVFLEKPIVVICKDEFKETFLLHLKVKAYVLDTRYEFLLMSDVTEAAKAEFLRHGLLRPTPPLRAYLFEDDEAGAEPEPAGDGAAPVAPPADEPPEA